MCLSLCLSCICSFLATFSLLSALSSLLCLCFVSTVRVSNKWISVELWRFFLQWILAIFFIMITGYRFLWFDCSTDLYIQWSSMKKSWSVTNCVLSFVYTLCVIPHCFWNSTNLTLRLFLINCFRKAVPAITYPIVTETTH